MADPELPANPIPAEHAETQAESIETNPVKKNKKRRLNIRIGHDRSYIKSFAGILKIAEILLGFLGFICIQTTYLAFHANGKWFSTVSMSGVLITAILFLCNLFHTAEKFKRLPWNKFEYLYCIVISICYLIASLMCVFMESKTLQAAAFFGFCAMIAYLLEGYMKFLASKTKAIEEGKMAISKENIAESAAD